MRAVIRLVSNIDVGGGVVRVRVFRGMVKVVRWYRGRRWVETVYVAPGTAAILHVAKSGRGCVVLIIGGRVARLWAEPWRG